MDAFEQPFRTVVIKDPTLKQFEGGFTALPNRILKHRDLSLGARMTYGMLLSYAWQKGFCHPAQESLATDLGVSDRSVRTFLNELRDARLITWKQQGLNKPNVYYLLKLPDLPVDNQAGPEDFSDPDRKPTSGQDRQPASDKEYTKNKTKNVNVINISSLKALPVESAEQKADEDYLVSEILAVCGDTHSTGSYRKLCREVPPDLIQEALSETRYAAAMGRIRQSRGAFFTDLITRYRDSRLQ